MYDDELGIIERTNSQGYIAPCALAVYKFSLKIRSRMITSNITMYYLKENRIYYSRFKKHWLKLSS